MNFMKYQEYLEGNDYHKRFAEMLGTFCPEVDTTLEERVVYKDSYEAHEAIVKQIEADIRKCKKKAGKYAALSKQDWDDTLKHLCYARRGRALHAKFWERAYKGQ